MKNKKYLIGVDGGTQSTKVLIFDLRGNIICEGKKDLQSMSLPEPGVVEHPDDDLWDSLIIAAKKAMDAFPGQKDEIIGLGLCTIRCCRVLLKADGTLASPVISWMDARLARPYEHDNPDVSFVTTTTGYITHRLTGEFNDTVANYEGQWPIDKDTWQWSENPEVFRQFNISRDMLFNLQLPGTIAGYITREAADATGMPEGLPVVNTANDKSVEALGAGLLPGRTALVSLGTYIASMVHGNKNIKDATDFFTNLASVPYQYLYESGGIRRGMWTVSWVKELLGDDAALKAKAQGISTETYLNNEGEKIPAGSDGLMTVHDWLARPDIAYRKGILIGFDGRHGGAHIYRSILEGIALTMKNHTDAMCRELNLDLDNIIISGGGSNSDLFMKIFADVYNLPACRNAVNGAAGLGSAICAALATGVYPDYISAIENMVRIRDTFKPNHDNAALYQRMNEEVYKDITKYTDQILKKSFPIFK
ncbi:MAG: FGGY family carbohydrate kinase [Bacillota bacterium]|nr:FGGY family carbohydrate kinase [Bacillota bacterium]